MLGHLAAYQRAATLATAFCNATNNLGDCLGFKLAHSNVIQEKQRLGAHGNNVVDAHGNQVLTYRIVAIEKLSNSKLSANAVGATDQYRLFHVFECCCREARAKATQAANDLGTSSCSNSSFDGVDRTSAFINVNACVSVGNLLGWISGSSHYSPSYCFEGTKPSSINCCSTWSNLRAKDGFRLSGVFSGKNLWWKSSGIATGYLPLKQDSQ